MKKQFLILLSLILILLGSEQIIFGQGVYEETKISIINKLSAKYSEDKVFLELIGDFHNISPDNIQADFKENSGVVVIDRVFLDPNISNGINTASIALPQIQEFGIVEFIEKDFKIQLSMQYSNLKFLEAPIITQNKITFFFEINLNEAGVNDVISVEQQPDFVVSKLYVKPDRLNITILHKNSTRKRAYQLSQNLLRQKIKIEKDLENPLNIVNITRVPLKNFGRNVIYFRENHYLSAIYLSDILQDVYVMMPFIHPERKKDIDLEILIIK